MKGRVIIRFSLFALSCSQFLLLSEISRGQNNFFPSGISVNQIVCTSTDPQCVWTYHNDNTRGGVNPNETTINPSTVGGLVASSVLTDGLIYAQPLFISNIPTSTPTCSPGNHNIVYVVTENNTVYAYDTASPGNLVNCWTTHLGPSGEAAAPYTALPEVPDKSNPNIFVPCNNMVAEAGVTSTPVIDINVNPPLMYVLAKTVDSSSTIHERLHVLRLGDGRDLKNWDVATQLLSNYTPAFNPAVLNQRAGLALYHQSGTKTSTIYAAWGSFCDSSELNSQLSSDPYTGWIGAFQMDYSGGGATPGLTSSGAFQVEPTPVSSNQGGIWMGGAAPAIDQKGTVFLSAGNGTFNATSQWGDTVIQLSPGTPTIIDWYTPNDYAQLNGTGTGQVCLAPLCPPGAQVTLPADIDLGSGGVVLLSTGLALTNPELVTAEKEGMIYVDWYSPNVPAPGSYNGVMGGLDSCTGTNAYHLCTVSPASVGCTPSSTGPAAGSLAQCWEGMFQNYQGINTTGDYGSRGSPAFIDASGTDYLYVAGINDVLKAFQFSVSNRIGTFNTSPVEPPSGHIFGYPGSSPSISWDGSHFSNAIIWTLDTSGSGYVNYDASGNVKPVQATNHAALYAYCAQPSSTYHLAQAAVANCRFCSTTQ